MTVTTQLSTVDPLVAVTVAVPAATDLMPKNVFVEPAPTVTLAAETATMAGLVDASVNVRSVASRVSESTPRVVVSSTVPSVNVGLDIVNTGAFTVMVCVSCCPPTTTVTVVVPFAVAVTGKFGSSSSTTGTSTVVLGVDKMPAVPNVTEASSAACGGTHIPTSISPAAPTSILVAGTPRKQKSWNWLLEALVTSTIVLSEDGPYDAVIVATPDVDPPVIVNCAPVAPSGTETDAGTIKTDGSLLTRLIEAPA